MSKKIGLGLMILFLFGWIGLHPLNKVWANQTHTFSSPSDDRWHYPFNFSMPAGSRPTGSCFGAVGTNFFNNRDGENFYGWLTFSQIASGQGAGNYHIHSVKVTLSNQANATWPVDYSFDEWFTFDLNGDGSINADGIPRGMPGDSDGESSDLDAGRPIELFGLGFSGPSPYTPETWQENAAYIGSIAGAPNAARNPFPMTFQEGTGALLHVEDNVSGLWNSNLANPVFNFTAEPWATGNPINYTPTNQTIPFDVEFEINLCQAENRVRQYFQNQLNAGKVFVAVNSLQETVQGAPLTNIYSFVMKEGVSQNPGSHAPQIEIELGNPLFDCNLNGTPDECEFGTLASHLKNQSSSSTDLIVHLQSDQTQTIEVQETSVVLPPLPPQTQNISSYYHLMRREIIRELQKFRKNPKFSLIYPWLQKNRISRRLLSSANPFLPLNSTPDNPNGIVQSTASAQAMVTVLAKEITEGPGGPPVAVVVDYQVNGGDFQPLFGGLPVSPGQNQTIDLDNGTLRFRGEGTVTAFSDSLNAIILQNGDSFDTIYEMRNVQPPFDNQNEITCYLSQFLDLNTHEVILPEGAMLILFELGSYTVGSVYYDFQDLIVFVNPL